MRAVVASLLAAFPLAAMAQGGGATHPASASPKASEVVSIGAISSSGLSILRLVLPAGFTFSVSRPVTVGANVRMFVAPMASFALHEPPQLRSGLIDPVPVHGDPLGPQAGLAAAVSYGVSEVLSIGVSGRYPSDPHLTSDPRHVTITPMSLDPSLSAVVTFTPNPYSRLSLFAGADFAVRSDSPGRSDGFVGQIDPSMEPVVGFSALFQF